jgi:hypothetical protein
MFPFLLGVMYLDYVTSPRRCEERESQNFSFWEKFSFCVWIQFRDMGEGFVKKC